MLGVRPSLTGIARPRNRLDRGVELCRNQYVVAVSDAWPLLAVITCLEETEGAGALLTSTRYRPAKRVPWFNLG
jgi:hypothetical protein